MKKAILTLAILVLSVSMVFADVSVGGKLEANSTTNSASVNYYLEYDSESTLNAYKIGFSSSAVEALTDTPADVTSSDQAMEVVGGSFVGTLASDLYVYWQIASNVACKITLTPTAMQIENVQSPTDADTLDITFETTDLKGTLTAGNGASLYAQATIDSVDGTAQDIVTYTTDVMSANNYQIAGSQKVSITTENLTGKNTGKFVGELTLTISATN